MPYSMTGFARQLTKGAWGEISCEIRSVNHRYLEPSIRLPELLHSLEPDIRDQLKANLQRGKVEVTIQLSIQENSQDFMSINQTCLDQVLSHIQTVQSKNTLVAAVDPIHLLQWPGVIEQRSPDIDAIQTAAKTLFQKTLALLLEHRQREGEILKAHIEQRLQKIGVLVTEIRQRLPEILALQKNKLKQRLSELQVELDKNRLEQEIVLLTNKADVAEELDRLETHLKEVHHILQ